MGKTMDLETRLELEHLLACALDIRLSVGIAMVFYMIFTDSNNNVWWGQFCHDYKDKALYYHYA